jgi:isopenicillin-N N-acyltransferase like protein
MIPLIETGGAPREIGVDVGRGAREQIRFACAQSRAELGGVEPAEVLANVGPYLAATEAAAPWVLDEMRGMAEGAGVPFETLFVLNAAAELMQSVGRFECTV